MSSASTSLYSSNYNVTAAVGEQELPDEGLSLTQIVLAVVIIAIMLGIGMAVDRKLLKHIVTTKPAILACAQGVCQQFVLMPLISLCLALAFDVDKYTALGFIMCGIVPGGTTSNAITTMSGGVLELSIFMTVCSTLLSFALTPLWLYLLSMAIDVDSAEMDFMALVLGFILLLIPLLIGILISFVFPKVKKYVETPVSVLTIVFVMIAIVVVCIENFGSLEQATWRVHVPACFYFLISSSLGYVLSAHVFKNAPAVNRTIFFEVGLQNTTLVYALVEITLRYKSQRDKAATFPILYSIWMFAWAFVSAVIFREHKKYNLKHGILDIDPNLDAMVNGMKAEVAAEKKAEEECEDDKKMEEGGDYVVRGAEPIANACPEDEVVTTPTDENEEGN